MGCGASKDGAGGVTGDKPKNSDPMVISLWRKRPRGRPVCQVAKRLIQAEVALRLSMIWRWRGVGGRTGRSEHLLFSHTGDQPRGAEERPTAERPPLQPGDHSCADTYAPEPYRLRVPASCANLLRTVRTEGPGQLAPGGQHCTHALHVRPTHVSRVRTAPGVPNVPRTVATQAIRELNISQCELEHIPEQISLLTSLLTLNVSQNRHAPHAQSAG